MPGVDDEEDDEDILEVKCVILTSWRYVKMAGLLAAEEGRVRIWCRVANAGAKVYGSPPNVGSLLEETKMLMRVK
jgi:hypothetical protein